MLGVFATGTAMQQVGTTETEPGFKPRFSLYSIERLLAGGVAPGSLSIQYPMTSSGAVIDYSVTQQLSSVAGRWVVVLLQSLSRKIVRTNHPSSIAILSLK